MAIPKFRDVLYEETGSIATVTLNRPDQLNAIRVGMYEEITEAVLHAGWNKDIGVIVLTGAGGMAFCVGGDSSDAKSARQGAPVCHRRRQCARHLVRSRDRVRKCAVRPGRPQGRLSRSGLRHGAAR